MDVSNNRGPARVKTRTVWIALTTLFATMALAACGGGTSPTSEPPPPPVAQCVPEDASTTAECGTVIIGLTDADGDFLSYAVNVLSLRFERANGSVIEVLPNRTRVDFAQYADLTEFISAATIPPGEYIAGSIRLDYSDAEIYVEADSAAKEAIVVDDDSFAIDQTELRIRLADRNHLDVRKGLVSLLTIDFDLDASHVVDIAPTPAVAVSEPFIVAEIEPVDTKDIRVRGRFLEANIDEMFYTVALRPFYDAVGDFGRVKVHITERTDFEVNGETWVGADGLRALTAAGEGTLTAAKGTLNVAERTYTARIVLAGSSVPGNGLDAVKGNVISRSGDTFTVRGGTVVLSDSDRAFFRDDVTVTVGPDTVVYKSLNTDRPLGMPVRLLDNAAISIGQAVTVRGAVIVNDETGIQIDATRGTVAMHMTHLLGVVNTIVPGQTDIALHAIDRRRVGVFDFTDTGMTPDTDADPDNYEVATGNLLTDMDGTGKPVVVRGYANEFGAAPPDFEGRTIINHFDVRSSLGVGWGADGTTQPFLMMDSTGLLLANGNPDIDQRHHVKHGPFLIDLTTLGSDTLIAPRETGRMLFVVKTSDSLQLYADFEDFLTALTLELDGVNAARSMHARGHFNRDTNVFTAYKIYVHILEP